MADAFPAVVESETFFTRNEVAAARLAAALRTATGHPMSEVGEKAGDLIDYLDESMARRDAYEYRHRAKRKTILAGATMLYAAYGSYDPEELDEVLEDAAETATGLVADERAAIPPTAVIRGQDHCPNCGSELQ